MTRTRPHRRQVLIGAVIGAGFAASMTSPTAKAAPANKQSSKNTHYRETEHVRRFYEVNRYPGGRHAR